jgi:hypothetical protein
MQRQGQKEQDRFGVERTDSLFGEGREKIKHIITWCDLSVKII